MAVRRVNTTMGDTKRSREANGKNKEAARRRREIERAQESTGEDLDFEELLETAEIEREADE